MNATICIGNSDDKLSQTEWSQYISAVSNYIADLSYTVYFAGFSNPKEPWQNACWVVDIRDDERHVIRELSYIARTFRQDSIAVIFGETIFVRPKETT